MIRPFSVCFFLIVFKLSLAQAPLYENTWVVWQVGQGQWVTHILTETCEHYDLGGELGSFYQIRSSLLQVCVKKENRMNLSHWHADHYLNIPVFIKSFPKVCWAQLPAYAIEKKSPQKILQLHVPRCFSSTKDDLHWTPAQARNTNESSIVHLTSQVLIPGDSNRAQEKNWLPKFKNLKSVQVLILGHHGSATSTGNILLNQLPRLKMTIASARYAVYHHPQPQTRQRLQQHHLPLLRTEDWGNIWFAL